MDTLVREQSQNLSFEPNQGQTNSQVRFLSRTGSYTLYLTNNEAVLQLRTSDTKTTRANRLL
jgi:hypothetical protein